MADLSVNIGELQMKNPVMTASGTFGYGEEFADFIDIARIGGIIVKGTTLHKREGNPYPRMAETPSGMLNAVGLQNKGVHYFVEHIYPRIKDIQTNMIVNVSGATVEDYAETASIINELDKIPAIELNISCPNVKQGGMSFGVTSKGAEEVVKAVRSVYKKTLIVKLSPNVTDRRSRCRQRFIDQYSAWNGYRCRKKTPHTLYHYRRYVRSSSQTHCPAHGMASCQSCKNTCHWFRRNHELERRSRIYASWSLCYTNRYCKLH